MTILVKESFEFGSSGTTVTTANSAFDVVVGAPTISTAWSASGTRSMDCSTTAAASRNGTLKTTDGAERTYYCYLNLQALPSAAQIVMNVQKADYSAICAQVQILDDGTIRLRSNGTSGQTSIWSGGPLGTQVYRLVLYINNTTSQIRLRVYFNHASTPLLDSGLLNYTRGVSGASNFGPTVNMANMAMLVDEAIIADGVEPPPAQLPISVDVGNDQATLVGQAVELVAATSGGSGSPSYTWTVQSGPNTSSSQFSAPSAASTNFTPTAAGTYIVRCTVSDTSGSDSDDLIVTVSSAQRMLWVKTITISG